MPRHSNGPPLLLTKRVPSIRKREVSAEGGDAGAATDAAGEALSAPGPSTQPTINDSIGRARRTARLAARERSLSEDPAQMQRNVAFQQTIAQPPRLVGAHVNSSNLV